MYFCPVISGFKTPGLKAAVPCGHSTPWEHGAPRNQDSAVCSAVSSVSASLLTLWTLFSGPMMGTPSLFLQSEPLVPLRALSL